jgi:WD40 repeat protein
MEGTSIVLTSPDGRFLAAGGGIDEMHGLMTKKTEASQLKTVIWEVSSFEDCRNIGSIHSDGVFYAVAFSPNGKLLAVAGEDCNIALLLAGNDFEPVLELPCTAGIRCLSWSSNGRCLVAGGEDRLLSVWDVVEARITHQFQKVPDWYCDVKWSTNGKWIASSWFGGKGVGVQHCASISQPFRKDAVSSTLKHGLLGAIKEQQDNVVSLESSAATLNDDRSLKVVIAIPLTIPSLES